jgi:hypothetical protein
MANYWSLSVAEQHRFDAFTYRVTDKGKTARAAIAAAVAATTQVGHDGGRRPEMKVLPTGVDTAVARAQFGLAPIMRTQ